MSWGLLPTKVSPRRISAERTRRKLGGGASGPVAHDKVRTEPRLTDNNTVTVKGKGKGKSTGAASASCGVDGRRRDRTTSDAQTGPSPRSLNEAGEEMSWASRIAAVIRGSLKRTGDGHVLPNSASFERAQDKTCLSTAQGTVCSTCRPSRNETAPVSYDLLISLPNVCRPSHSSWTQLARAH